MRKTLKFSITLVLAVAMLFTVALIASAETASGSCGDSLTWEYVADTQTLVISGKGEMTEYGTYANFPWHAYRAEIKAIELSEGLTNIPAQAFRACTALEEIVVPNSVKTIGTYAFLGCTSLDAVTLGTGVETVGANAFGSCDTLTTVNAVSLDSWATINFDDVYANPIAAAKALYVNGELVTEIVLSDSVKAIGKNAFNRCVPLTSITIPASITSIGDGAFEYCSNMVAKVLDGTFAEKYFASTNIKYQINRDDATDGGKFTETINWYFYEDTKTLVIEGTGYMTNPAFRQELPWFPYVGVIENVEISEGIITIGRYALAVIPNLKSVVIPNSVETIYNDSFMSSTGLESITLGTGVREIYAGAFANCTSLTKVYISDLAKWCEIDFKASTASPIAAGSVQKPTNLYLNGELVTNLVIPEGVTKVSNYAFYKNFALKSVVFADTVESVGNYTFMGCLGLEQVTVGKGIKTFGLECFAGANNIQLVNAADLATWSQIDFATITANPSFVAHKLYIHGVGASQINIPEGVTNLGKMSFYAVFNAKSLTIPASVVSADSEAILYNLYADVVYGVPGTYAEEIAAKKYASKATFVNVADKPVVAVESISLADEAVALTVGNKYTVFAELAPADAYEVLNWTSTDNSVVTVVNGVLTAVAEGNATVTATAESGASATVEVSVSAKNILPLGLELNVEQLVLTEGDTYELEAVVTPEGFAYDSIEWASDNAAVSVSNGVLTAEAEGTATITVTVAGFVATCKVTVIAAPEIVLPPVVEVESIELDKNEATLAPKATVQLVATVNPADAEYDAIVWTSNNTAVATVVDGLVTAIADGKAVITAAIGDITAECVVTVETPNIPVEEIALDVEELELIFGEEYDFTVIFTPADTTERNLFWESTNEDVATIDQDGHLVAIAPGITVITVLSDDNYDLAAECTVTVTSGVAVQGVTLSATTASLNIGDTKTLTVAFNPTNATNKNVTWTTSNADIATVEDGVVTAIGSGVATITVTSEDGEFTATCKVIVTVGNETPALPW